MPRHALRAELAAKLSDGWTGPAGRHVLDAEMPDPTGVAGRHALADEVEAIVTGPVIPEFHGTAQNRGFTATNDVGPVTGTLPGDVMLAFASGNDQTASITPPAGWTQIGDTGGAVAGRLRVFATTATSINQTGGVWTWPGSHNHSVAVLAYGGVVAPTAAGMVRAGAGATSVAAPSRTSLAPGALLVVYAFFVTNGSAPAWQAPLVVRSPHLAASASGVGADETLAAAGATSTRTFTAGTTAPAALTAASVVLEPAP
jgi:hypothetical protein